MEQVYYWPVDPVTRIVSQQALETDYRGGIHHVPKFALRSEPLEPKDGFAVVAVLDPNGVPVGSEYIEDHRGQTIYDTANCLKSKEMDELGPVPAGWTLKKPATEFDFWVDDAWQTDYAAKSAADQQAIADARVKACSAIDLAADAARRRFVSPGDLIEKEYEVALQQAKDWLAAGMPDPVPSAVQSGVAASNNTLTAEQAAQEIIDMAAAWEGVLMTTREIRLSGKAAVNAAADDADFDVVAKPYLDQLDAIKP